jgi:hypothetical protein
MRRDDGLTEQDGESYGRVLNDGGGRDLDYDLIGMTTQRH